MFSFKRRSLDQKSTPVRAAIEPLEARVFSATPANVTLTVPGPIPTSAIAGVVVNDRIKVSVADNDVIKARGRANIALFASLDSTVDANDALIPTATPVGLNIAPGRSHTFSVRIKSFPQNLNGTYFILAEITGAGVNPGINQTSASSITTISVEQAVIDLAGTVTKTPLNGHAGRKIPVSVEVTNDGNILAKGNALAVDFSLSATPDGAAPFSLGSLTKRIALKPGKSTVLHFMVPLALGVPTGNEYIVADVDPSNVFGDPNLLNNVNVGQQPVTVS